MRVLTARAQTLLDSEAPPICHLFSLTVGGTTYYINDVDRDVPYGGHTYISGEIAGGAIRQEDEGIILSCSIEMADFDDVWSTRFTTYGIWAHALIIYRAILDPATFYGVEQAFAVFTGMTTGGKKVPTLTIEADTNRMIWNAKSPPTALQPVCPYAYTNFKGAKCQYAGAEMLCLGDWTTCNGSGAGQMNNGVHFGGMRFLPDQNAQLDMGGTLATVPRKADYLVDARHTGHAGHKKPKKRV